MYCANLDWNCLVVVVKYYACAEGGTHLPIAHALRVRRVKKKYVEGKKKKEQGRRRMPSLVDIFNREFEELHEKAITFDLWC